MASKKIFTLAQEMETLNGILYIKDDDSSAKKSCPPVLLKSGYYQKHIQHNNSTQMTPSKRGPSSTNFHASFNIAPLNHASGLFLCSSTQFYFLKFFYLYSIPLFLLLYFHPS